MDPNSDLLIAGQITSSSYKKGYRPYFNIQVLYVDYNGKTFHYRSSSIDITTFLSHTEIDLLPAQPLDDPKLREYLTSRGRTFVQLQGKHFLEYHDFLLARGEFGQLLKYRATDGSCYG